MENYENEFKQFLGKLSFCLEGSSISIPDELCFTKHEFENYLKNNSSIDSISLLQFLARYNISPDSILKRRVDVVELAARMQGLRPSMPSHYIMNAGSKVRAVNYIINYVEESLGEAEKIRIYRKFQLTDCLLRNEDQQVNAQLSLDICNYLDVKVRNPFYLEAVGRNFYRNNQRTELGGLIKNARNIVEVHELIFNELIHSHIEKNFNWKLQKISSDSCIVHGEPTEKFKDERKDKSLDNRGIAHLRKGFISSIPLFLGLGPTKEILMEKSPSMGNPFYRFKINLESIGCVLH